MREEETPYGFDALDPAMGDPGYWDRFQDRTMSLVAPELIRRRQALERMTVADVVLSWSRAVVPVAMAAAAASVLVLLGEPVPGEEADATAGSDVVLAVDETVVSEESPRAVVDGGPIPALAEEEVDEIPMVLTASVEGF